MPEETFTNPLIESGADPSLVYYDGNYHLTWTSGDGIYMRKARKIQDLGSSHAIEVWKDLTPTRCTQIWAPEFYLIDSEHGRRWYGYYTASDGVDIHHRMHVIESEGTDPLGPYHYAGQLATDPNNEYYAIDGTVLATPDGRRFFIWAGHPGHVLYISEMSNPWTTIGNRVHLPADGFGCSEVREGPVALLRNGKIFLVYSACDTGKPDYKLGMLIADDTIDPLNPSSWIQHPDPVFTRCDDHEVYGPGHNHFFKSPDGTQDWIIYHAKHVQEYTYQYRSTRVQPFAWTPDGLPDFGTPIKLHIPTAAPSGQ